MLIYIKIHCISLTHKEAYFFFIINFKQRMCVRRFHTVMLPKQTVMFPYKHMPSEHNDDKLER